MNKAYVFDWGDTLMVDFPGVPGAMKDWRKVEAIDDAEKTLQSLSLFADIYVATGAPDTTPENIEAALARVKLAQYIAGFFCKANLGLNKPSPEYYAEIVRRINIPASEITMVGDNLDKDILPALVTGMQGCWFNPEKKACEKTGFRTITKLTELIPS